MQLDECDPKPEKPIEYIVERIGFKTIGIDEFLALKDDFNRLRDDVSSMRKELTKLKMQFIDDVQDIENNNIPIDQSTINGHEKSMGLVFGDICFEKFTNGNESYNVFAKVNNCSLINENTNVISTSDSDLATFWPEKQNDSFETACEIDSSAHDAILNETSGITFLEKMPKERCTDENTSVTVSLKEIISVKPKTSAINASHSTEISGEVIMEIDAQSIADISLDQSKTSANDCSHSTDIETEFNVLACQGAGSASETFNTDETSDIQVFEMITEEHETDENKNATKSSDETIPSEMLQTDPGVSVEVNEKSDDQSITDISFDQLETSADDCSQSTDVEAEINFLACESIESGYENETTIDGLSVIQVLEVIPEEHETDENTSTTSSEDTTQTETGQSAPQSMAIHPNEAAAAADLNIGEQSSPNITVISSDLLTMIDSEIKDKSHETSYESFETQENSIETESVDKNNVSETTENIEKMIRNCFIQNCNEMQAAKLPPSDSEDSEVKTSNTTQSDEMVTCNIYQQLSNDEVREMTGLNISDSAKCFEMNTTVRPVQPDCALIMEDIEISDQYSSHSSTSRSSLDAKTVVECTAQNELDKDCRDGISDHGEKVPNGIEEVKARLFPPDDIETEFLLSVSSAAQRSVRTFPTK